METFTLENDIVVCAEKAKSFPDGIMESYSKLFSKLPNANGRRIFGMSRPEDGQDIVYYAAAEQASVSEAKELGLVPLIIKKGTYIYRDISDYMQDLPVIGKTFMEILREPGIDPNGYCVEMYTSQKDVRCMVRMA